MTAKIEADLQAAIAEFKAKYFAKIVMVVEVGDRARRQPVGSTRDSGADAGPLARRTRNSTSD